METRRHYPYRTRFFLISVLSLLLTGLLTGLIEINPPQVAKAYSSRSDVIAKARYWAAQPMYYTNDLAYREGIWNASLGKYGFDCSGYVYRVFTDTGNGTLIQNSSSIVSQLNSPLGQQMDATNYAAPPPSGLEPGDLLVFKGSDGNPHWHVAIVTTLGATIGDTKVIGTANGQLLDLPISSGYLTGYTSTGVYISANMFVHFTQFGSSEYASQFAWQSLGSVNLTPGSMATLIVTTWNIGTVTWLRDGTQTPVRLGTVNPVDHLSPFFPGAGVGGWLDAGRVVMEQASVAPGQYATFIIPLLVPGNLADGTYTESFQLLAENKLRFGDKVITLNINVMTPPATVGQGSTRQASFQQAWARAGGAAVMGPPSGGVYWWNSLVRQNFNWNFAAGRGNAILQDENWENANAVPAGTCKAYYTLDGLGTYYEWTGNYANFGAATSDPYVVNGQLRQSFSNAYIYQNGATYASVPWASIATTGWRIEYYNNPVLGCGIASIAAEPNLNFNYNWGWYNPLPGIFDNNWSARLTRTETFTAGNYTITAGSDDGVRVWLDNTLVIDKWIARTYTQDSWTGAISAGSHQLKIEYFDATNAAQLSFSVTPALPTLAVTNAVDLGEQTDGNSPGTLSYALLQARTSTYKTITFSGVSTIQVKGKLPDIWAGINLQGLCTNGKPSVIIDGSGVTTVTDGLVLNGTNLLYGVQVKKFKGRQIRAIGSGNKLLCVTTTN